MHHHPTPPAASLQHTLEHVVVPKESCDFLSMEGWGLVKM
jgi:hypothetical protein